MDQDTQAPAAAPAARQGTETRPARRRAKRWPALLIAVLLSGLAAAWWAPGSPVPGWLAKFQAERAAGGGSPGGRGPGGGGRRDAPVPVVVAPVERGDLPILIEALGSVTPLASVTVRSQVSGQLQALGFKDGQMVQAGDFLAQIDPRPYERQLAQYRGQLARDQALLKEARQNLARYKTLAAQDSIARQQLDTQESLVQQQMAAIEIDMAQIETAQLNISYCRITAPISGRVGLRHVDVGNYIQAGDATGLVVITQTRPASVIFTLAEDRLPAVMRRLAEGAVLMVTLHDRGGVTQLAEGPLVAVDNQIDASTGTVKLKAEFPNADGTLFPNQFVNVRLLVDTLRGVTLAPTAAIQRGAPGAFVYLVEGEDKVVVRPVQTGASADGRVVVSAGLAPGDRVVIDGTDRLRDGAAIRLGARPPRPEGGAAPGRQP